MMVGQLKLTPTLTMENELCQTIYSSRSVRQAPASILSCLMRFTRQFGIFAMFFGVKNRQRTCFRLTKPFLVVELASNILDVQGFPIRIKKGSNPIETVIHSLKLK